MRQRGHSHHAVEVASVAKAAAMIVAHPDDEILWAGGLLIEMPAHWFVTTLCRASDQDRAPKFRTVLAQLGVEGSMADLDDGPEQHPLDPRVVESAIIETLPRSRFDLVVTHGPQGEYTRHRRHEEVCRAVINLWRLGELRTDWLWMFAYHDDSGSRLPAADDSAHRRTVLSDVVWKKKYDLITSLYGFAHTSWEARVTPKEEAFWCFNDPERAESWMTTREIKNESPHAL